MQSEGLQGQLRAAIQAHERGDIEAAEQGYRAVLALEPAQPDAVHFLGLALHQRGQSAAALPWLERALLLAPNNFQFRGNLGSVLQQLGRSDDAEQLFREALALKSDYLGGYINLGMLYATRGDYLRALAEFDRALSLDPSSFAACFNRAESLRQLARRKESLAAYRHAAEIGAADPDLQVTVGTALREAGEVDEALRRHARALELAPEYPPAENSLGNLLGMKGDFIAAEAHYRRALKLKPDYAGAYYNLADVKKLGPEDPAWPGLMGLAERAATLPADEAMALHFALGKVWEGQQEYARAFGHFTAGNRLRRAGLNYDETRQTRFFTEFAQIFGANFVGSHALDTKDPRPVFIVGMPRSGTTLVEQILASHPDVYGAGEVHALRACVREALPPDPGDYALPTGLATLSREAFQPVARRYSAWLDSVAPEAKRITNKLPGNMVFVGLMALLYPQAKIIHVSREPMDTCLSCYSKLFTTGHPFAYEQAELGRFYRMYDALMAHWRTALPGRMLELRYEDLVADVEGQARRLVAHLELPWDEACLRFHESSRAVRTASLAQVRRPIYKDSVQRWKRYQKELAPLEAALK